VEAQNVMDISYWKHFVSKQEYILHGIKKQVTDSTSSLEECLRERHATNIQLNHIQKTITSLESRQDIIEDEIIKSTTKLLTARQQLYVASTRTTATATAATTSCTTKKKKKGKNEEEEASK